MKIDRTEIKENYNQLTYSLSDVTWEIRDAVELAVKDLLDKHQGTFIEFKSTVSIHLIADDLKVDCISIQMGDDRSLTFQCVENARGQFREYDEVIENLTVYALFELLRALAEDEIEIKK